MSDIGLNWEWHRTEFLKALMNCANAATDIEFWEGLDLFAELYSCSLLMLNFRDRLSLKQQKELCNLATACHFDDSEIHGDPEWDDEITRSFIEDAIKHARRSRPLL